ncbi:MAG: S-layer homology domain-containing protein [Thermoanaerobaculia bacterium]
MSVRRRLLLVAVALCATAAAKAQVLPHPSQPDPAGQRAALEAQRAILASPNQFGTNCCQILQIPSSSFHPTETLQGGYTNWSNGYIAPLGGQSYAALWATVTLPSGAALDYLDLYYYDIDSLTDICADLHAYTGPTFGGDPPGDSVLATTCSSGSAGYGYATAAVSGTISNNVFYNSSAADYVVVVSDVAPSNFLQFKAVDIWWHRQVSPALAAATFNDVPTNHPFFQFVEALAASGITVGCQLNPPLYCPDAPLTRKQMAAFLAKGFGLYWPY